MRCKDQLNLQLLINQIFFVASCIVFSSNNVTDTRLFTVLVCLYNEAHTGMIRHRAMNIPCSSFDVTVTTLHSAQWQNSVVPKYPTNLRLKLCILPEGGGAAGLHFSHNAATRTWQESCGGNVMTEMFLFNCVRRLFSLTACETLVSKLTQPGLVLFPTFPLRCTVMMSPTRQLDDGRIRPHIHEKQHTHTTDSTVAKRIPPNILRCIAEQK